METHDNNLNFRVTAGSLLKYAMPTMLSSLFMNIYSIVDQLFVSNLLGTDALSAVSIAGPFLALALAIGTMIATGGCALVSSLMGEGKEERARGLFSFFMLFSFFISVAFCAAGIFWRRPILYAMGADAELYSLCEAYAIPIFLMTPFVMISIVLQIFFVAAGKPGLGFVLSLAGGAMNIGLDYILIAVVPLGVAGAAYATGAGYLLQAVIGVVFFWANRRGTLYFVRPHFDGRALVKACSNGMSEMVGMLAGTVAMIAMNVILMRLTGPHGVAAAAIILAAQTILSAAYAGYVQGIAPVISYHFGGGHDEELRKLYRVALKTIAVMSGITFAAAYPLASPIARLFAEGEKDVIDMSMRGMYIFASAFLLMGINLFASGFFTALNDGKTSAVLSLFRTLIFLMLPLLALPPLLGVDGVWVSMPVAEVLSALMSIIYFRKLKTKYRYA